MTRRSPNGKNVERIEKEKTGFKIHALVTLSVMALLAFINLTFVPEFLWFLFPVFGMSVGLTAHYMFGVRGSENPVY